MSTFPCPSMASTWRATNFRTLCTCKSPKDVYKILCNIHKTCKILESQQILDHINKANTLAYQLACLTLPLRKKNVIMTLLKTLSTSYKYLITTSDTIPIKDLILEDVIACLMHRMSMRKGKNTKKQRGNDDVKA